MAKRYEQIKRFRLGPLDLVGAPMGRTRRVLETPLARRLFGRSAERQHVEASPRVTRDELTRLAERDPAARATVEQIEGLQWYHTLDLRDGVRTPGFVDHKDQLPFYGLPDSLAGKRCLDIATFDGYWAFEFERRGATDVVAIDIPDRRDLDCPRLMLRDPEAFEVAGPLGTSFKVAHKLKESKVERVEKSVYDLNPEDDGMFDLVFISDVLIHLRDPQLALERAFSVCRGEIIVADVYSPQLDALNVPVAQFLSPSESWWYPNVACLKQMMTVAGFEPVTEVSRFQLDALGNPIDKVVLRAPAAAEPQWMTSQRKSRAQQRAGRESAMTS